MLQNNMAQRSFYRVRFMMKRYQKAMELQQEHGYVFVHPFDDEDVIEGQGTIALEVLEELPDADVLLVPVGGGGIVSGIAAAAKLKNPSIKINRCRT